MLYTVRLVYAIRKYFSYFSIPTFNIGIFAYAQIPSFVLIEEIFKLLLLIATFIFTVIKIYFLIKNKQLDKKDG